MSAFAQIVELLRSISFGALLANCLLFMVFARHPNLFPAGMTPKELFYFGTAIGTLLHRSINSIIFNPLTRSLARSMVFYTKVLELDINRRRGLLTEDEHSRFSADLKAQYFGVSGGVPSTTKVVTPEKANESKSLVEAPSEGAVSPPLSAKSSTRRKRRPKKVTVPEAQPELSDVDS